VKRNVPLAQASSEEAVLSTRVQEALGQRSTSKSAVSRTFVERTRRSLGELMSRRLDDVRLAVMMIDGLELQGRN
jgi:hypothetical protein